MSRNIGSLVSRLTRLAGRSPSPAAAAATAAARTRQTRTVSFLLRPQTSRATTTTTMTSSTTTTKTTTATATATTTTTTTMRSFSATPAHAAKAAAGGKGGKGGGKGGKGGKRSKKGGDLPDPRIRNLKLSTPRKVPAPLRFGRNRHLRHWTIHRAWMLWQRKEREREERELMRMYQSMHSACEELRKTSGPGTLGEGYLYRVAMEKKGLFSHGAIPIEYARAQTETPARVPWNHDWTR